MRTTALLLYLFAAPLGLGSDNPATDIDASVDWNDICDGSQPCGDNPYDTAAIAAQTLVP
jgi:hypothetical protein